jgi:hypothetical protein
MENHRGDDARLVLSQLGPFLRHPPVKAMCDLSAAAYAAYHKAVDTTDQSKHRPQQHIVIRMMYLAESTSTAVRLNTTWGLSLPGMSLVRDRYEQCVRFSWLARQKDTKEWAKYLGSYYSKVIKLYQSMTPTQRAEYDTLQGPAEPWVAEKPTRAQREYLARWSALPLDVLASKRDKMLGVGTTRLDRATLADLYTSVYAHFSSVTHYDFYSLSMLALYPSKHGPHVLAPDPKWPAILGVENALFDIIQCREATAAYFDSKDAETYSALYAEWHNCLERMGLKKAKPPSA